MARLQDLLDKRATAWESCKDYQSRAGDEKWTSEDDAAYNRALDEVDKLSKDIEREERTNRIDAAMSGAEPQSRGRQTSASGDGGQEVPAEQRYEQAFGRFLRRGLDGLSVEDRQMMMGNFEELEEVRALGTGVPSAGGYTVPTTFADKLQEAVKSYGGIIDEAEELVTDSGNPIGWPTFDDTANVGALLAENTQVTEQDFTFANGALGAYMFTSKATRVPFSLLQDSAVDLEAKIPQWHGERIGRALAPYLISGTGSGQPQGILTGLTQVKTTAASAAVSYDDLVDLEFQIDPAYRPRAKYVVADTFVQALRKLKDTTGRPLWVPSVVAGAPSTINGYPYSIDNSLPAFAATVKPAIFGDIKSAFIVRKVRGIQSLRLTERYADFLQVGFPSFARYDSRVQNTAAAAALLIKT